MGVVAAMHVAVLVVLARSFGIIPAAKGPPPIDLVPVAEPPATETPPPKPQFQPDRFEVTLPQPEPVPVESDHAEGAITARLVPDGERRGDTGSAEVIRKEVFDVRTDPRHPLTQPPYPPSRIRGNDEGMVDLEIYVLPDGRVGDARVVRSSGFEDFDRSALQEARRNWRMLPAMRDGQAIAQWYRLRVVFKLQNAR